MVVDEIVISKEVNIMNELMVVFGNENWLYFKTNAMNCTDAETELITKAEEIGLNLDNMTAFSMELRNEAGDNIDE